MFFFRVPPSASEPDRHEDIEASSTEITRIIPLEVCTLSLKSRSIIYMYFQWYRFLVIITIMRERCFNKRVGLFLRCKCKAPGEHDRKEMRFQVAQWVPEPSFKILPSKNIRRLAKTLWPRNLHFKPQTYLRGTICLTQPKPC